MSHSSSAAEGPARILVIKHGALGDFILATGPFAAIRRHHRRARLTLLTTARYEDLAWRLGHFDAVWVDRKPRLHQLREGFLLRRRLHSGRFMRVYDLQTSQRSSFYFRLVGRPRPEWSGIAPGCSHPHANPARDRMHVIEIQAEQLAMASIAAVPPPIFPGWTPISPVSISPMISRCSSPAAHRTDRPSAGHRHALARWPLSWPAGASSRS